MSTTNIERHPWGFAVGPADAEVTLAVVGGQHGDEFEGQMVAAKWAYMVARFARHGAQGLLRDPAGAGDLVKLDLSMLVGMRLIVAPGLNRGGLAVGCRWYVDDPAWGATERYHLYDEVDLNRVWPSGHHVVATVWDAINAAPGKVHVVDVHSHGQWPSKSQPRDYAYVAGSNVADQRDRILSECCPDLPLRGTLQPGCLLTAATEAGHWACVLEMAERSASTVHDGIQTILAIARHIAGAA